EAAKLEELRRRMLIAGHRRSKRELPEILKQIVQRHRRRVAGSPQPIAQRERVDRKGRQPEQVIAAVEHHVDSEIVPRIELECRAVAIAKLEAAPFQLAVERRMLQSRESFEIEQPLEKIFRVNAAERREHLS